MRPTLPQLLAVPRLVVAALVLMAPAASAQVPAGGELRVNTYTTASQVSPAVSVDGAGNYVVVWHTQDPPTHVRGQRFDRLGSPLGAEFLVDGGAALVWRAKVAADASGGFTVVWIRAVSDIDRDVIGRRYDAAGAPIGGEFQVNSYTAGYQGLGAIGSEPSGAFVVVWTSMGQDGSGAGIFGRRFDAAGNPAGPEFAVNSHTAGNQSVPAMAMDAAGNFTVVWRDAPGGGLVPAGVVGQRFTRDGVRIGAEFQVSASLTGVVHYPVASIAPGGGFVVAWADSTNGPTSLVGRRYDAAGSPQGAEFALSRLRQGPWVIEPALSMDAADRFVVAWQDIVEPSSDFDVWARRFDAGGTPRGVAFRVNASTMGHQVLQAMASDPQGNLLLAWSSTHAEGNFFDVEAQRYRPLSPHRIEVDPSTAMGSDGNRVLEAGETVEMRPAWHNHTGGALSLSGRLSGLTGPPGPVYGVVDGIGGYGFVPDSGVAPCLDCYAVSVAAPAGRPSLHWDSRATEVLNSDDEGHVDWILHVGDSFTDVPRANPFYRFVETFLHHGLTAGCGATTYCAGASTTREQMAPLVLVAKEGSAYLPAACTVQAMFADVPPSSPFCRWIEELARRGVVGGCGGPNYCPTAAVTREQMAVFVLRTLDPALNPPACVAGSELFADVPASSPFCRWIEELARRGVVTGCGGGNYCPGAPVTREQMAVFLSATFGLTLYGP